MSLAALGKRDMDEGPERLEAAALAQVRRQARRVNITATVLAIVATAAASTWP